MSIVQHHTIWPKIESTKNGVWPIPGKQMVANICQYEGHRFFAILFLQNGGKTDECETLKVNNAEN
jgi:hypothetical protein